MAIERLLDARTILFLQRIKVFCRDPYNMEVSKPFEGVPELKSDGIIQDIFVASLVENTLNSLRKSLNSLSDEDFCVDLRQEYKSMFDALIIFGDIQNKVERQLTYYNEFIRGVPAVGSASASSVSLSETYISGIAWSRVVEEICKLIIEHKVSNFFPALYFFVTELGQLKDSDQMDLLAIVKAILELQIEAKGPYLPGCFIKGQMESESRGGFMEALCKKWAVRRSQVQPFELELGSPGGIISEPVVSPSGMVPAVEVTCWSPMAAGVSDSSSVLTPRVSNLRSPGPSMSSPPSSKTSFSFLGFWGVRNANENTPPATTATGRPASLKL